MFPWTSMCKWCCRRRRKLKKVKLEHIFMLGVVSFVVTLLIYNTATSIHTAAFTRSLTGQFRMLRPQAPEKPPTYYSKGEEIAANLTNLCESYRPLPIFTMKVSTSPKHNIMYCPVCKVASTFWTRFFVMLNSQNGIYNTPYDVPIYKAPPSKEILKSRQGQISPYYKSKYKFLFVRNPYSRVLSAYVDKLFAPNPFYWHGMSMNIISRLRKRHSRGEVTRTSTCGSDLTFLEYVHALVIRHRLKRSLDCHDSEFHFDCYVCDVEYDFVGKMETFVNDSFFLFQKLQLNRTVESLAENYSRLAEEDALVDSVSSAFRWRKDIENCVSFDEALRRIWKKLQIRGVIGKDKFPLSKTQSKHITELEFINLAKTTRAKTPVEERKKQRHEAIIEIYRTVPMHLLLQLKDIYEKDFELFQYDPFPADIYKRDNDIDYFGYLDL